jgi:hypothetical protein
LIEGDCFFYHTDEQATNRQQELARFAEARKAAGLDEMTPADYYNFYLATMKGYVVVCINIETGRRCCQRLADGKYLLWGSNDDKVLLARDKKAFDARLKAMKKANAKMQQELEKVARARSKKENKKQLQVS